MKKVLFISIFFLTFGLLGSTSPVYAQFNCLELTVTDKYTDSNTNDVEYRLNSSGNFDSNQLTFNGQVTFGSGDDLRDLRIEVNVGRKPIKIEMEEQVNSSGSQGVILFSNSTPFTINDQDVLTGDPIGIVVNGNSISMANCKSSLSVKSIFNAAAIMSGTGYNNSCDQLDVNSFDPSLPIYLYSCKNGTLDEFWNDCSPSQGLKSLPCPSQGSFCKPCVSANTIIINEYGATCDENRVCGTSGTRPLICKPVQEGTIVNRCLFEAKTTSSYSLVIINGQVGPDPLSSVSYTDARCHLSGDECAPRSNDVIRCLKIDSNGNVSDNASYFGVCASVTTDTSDCNKFPEGTGLGSKDDFCKRLLGKQTAICKIESSEGRCIDPNNSEDVPNSAAEDSFGESNQFGARNCPTGAENVNCVRCITSRDTWVSGIGCIATSPEGLFLSVIRIMLGVMGGVALLRLIILGFQYQFASEAELKKSREGVISTLGAIIIALFSVLILQFIGVNVLDVVAPGFFGG